MTNSLILFLWNDIEFSTFTLNLLLVVFNGFIIGIFSFYLGASWFFKHKNKYMFYFNGFNWVLWNIFLIENTKIYDILKEEDKTL